MSPLKRIGFFREMAHGESADPSLATARADEPAAHQIDLAAYLDAGHVLFATPGPSMDVIDGHTPTAPPHYLTDGVYVWPGDLAHYVRTYNVRLPLDFVAYAMANGFAIPDSIDTSLQL